MHSPLAAKKDRAEKLRNLIVNAKAELYNLETEITRIEALENRPRPSRSIVPKGDGIDVQNVRRWAAANGWPHVLGARGRLPGAAISAYLAAHS